MNTVQKCFAALFVLTCLAWGLPSSASADTAGQKICKRHIAAWLRPYYCPTGGSGNEQKQTTRDRTSRPVVDKPDHDKCDRDDDDNDDKKEHKSKGKY